MAHMIPSQCPPETASQAEKELFEALRHGLGPHYTVIHSLPWLSDERRRLREGECDFLLLHPEHGMLALETKSGEIRFDGVSRSWIRGESQIVDDPFLQAERSVHELNHRLCERLPAWRNAGVPFGYAVALPHADRFRGALPPHVHPDILLLRPDLIACQFTQGPGTILPDLGIFVRKGRHQVLQLGHVSNSRLCQLSQGPGGHLPAFLRPALQYDQQGRQ